MLVETAQVLRSLMHATRLSGKSLHFKRTPGVQTIANDDIYDIRHMRATNSSFTNFIFRPDLFNVSS